MQLKVTFSGFQTTINNKEILKNNIVKEKNTSDCFGLRNKIILRELCPWRNKIRKTT